LDSGCALGGILKLRELISEHPAEFTYDFRHRFNLSLEDIGVKITWYEAIRLTSILLKDPSSWVQASMSEWDYPVSRDWIALSHLYDLLAMVNSKRKPKPYPTPWPSAGTTRLKPKKAQDRSEVLKKLRMMNPKD
jgi:hypothetical protein